LFFSSNQIQEFSGGELYILCQCDIINIDWYKWI